MKTKKRTVIFTKLIAPCGMNRRLCRAYKRQKNPCPGCRENEKRTTGSKAYFRCKIRNCEMIAAGKAKYCFNCRSFPCADLQHLDKRYATEYDMSMIENLARIKEHGIKNFVQHEKERWACSECGGIICVHKPICPACGHLRRK